MEKKMRSGRTMMRVVLLFALCIGVFAFSAAAEEVAGTCGESVNWTYDTETDVLSIMGTGEMDKFSSSSKVPWYTYRAELKEVTIGNGVTSVAPYAFDDCSALAEVTLAEGITAIGQCAFYNCTALTEIDLPNSLTSLGNYVFQKSGLQSVTVPGSIASIPSSAFYNCTALENVVLCEGVQKIGTSAFSGCTALKTLDLPSTLTEIGSSAFKGCSKLSAVSLPEGLKTIRGDAFADCESLTTITIPYTIDLMSSDTFENSVRKVIFADGMVTILVNACYGANRLTEVVIPDSVARIGGNAFQECASLETIDLPDGLTWFGNSVFADCTALEAIDLPEGLKEIGGRVFENCTSLETVVVPSTVTTMGTRIFAVGVKNVVFAEGMTAIPKSACRGAASLETVEIPATAESFGEEAFKDCAALTAFTAHKELADITVGKNALAGCVITNACGTSLTWSLNMETKILRISGTGEMSFGAADRAPWYPLRDYVEYIRMEEGMTTVADHAFYGLSGLRSAVVPDTVTAVGAHAFENCASLLRVELSKRLQTVGEDAFLGCDVLKTIIFCGDRVSVEEAALPQGSDVTVYLPESADSWEEEDAFASYEGVQIETWVMEQPTRDIALVLDSSGSMQGERIETLILAAQKLIEETGGRLSNTRFSIIDYDSKATVLCDFTSDVVMLCDYLNKMTALGDTYFGKALTAAESQLYGSDADSRCLVLFSDGEPTDKAAAILNQAAELREDYNLYTIGLDTDDETRQLLIDIAGNKERYFEAENIDSLIALFGSMADELGFGDGITQVTIVRGGEEYDLLNSMHTFRDGSDEVVDILVDPEWGNAVRGTVTLAQGNGTVLEDEYGNFRDIRPGRLFDPYLNIYVQLRDDDGYVIAERRILLTVDMGVRMPDKSNLYYQVPEERLFRVHSYPN